MYAGLRPEGTSLRAFVDVSLAPSRAHRARGRRAVVSPDMVGLRAGVFWMGSADDEGDRDEHPRHQVRVASFCIERTEVSIGAYQRCVAAGWCAFSDEDRGTSGVVSLCSVNRVDHADEPVTCVDRIQARRYCEWPGHAGGPRRLLREAEWEYAARGPSGRRFAWGDELLDGSRANFCGEECVTFMRTFDRRAYAMSNWHDAFGHVAPVESMPLGATPEGVLHMTDNVREWVDDAYAPDQYAQQARASAGGAFDAQSASSRRPMRQFRSERGVLRGATWLDDNSSHVRAAIRGNVLSTWRDVDVGLRCGAGAR